MRNKKVGGQPYVRKLLSSKNTTIKSGNMKFKFCYSTACTLDGYGQYTKSITLPGKQGISSKRILKNMDLNKFTTSLMFLNSRSCSQEDVSDSYTPKNLALAYEYMLVFLPKLK